ncbi:MAG: DUF2845 domain-containing protein [Deferrisomatales bacterium]|nr:DUF2845 domain-containing protein [Deferrisomatales bacterium]
MFRRNLVVCLFLVVCAAARPLGADARYLRCGADVVAVGDRHFDLLQRCGEPDHVEARTRERAVLVWEPGRKALRELRTTVEAEEWTHNFGPHRFYYVVRLEDGRVTAIESGGRGY